MEQGTAIYDPVIHLTSIIEDVLHDPMCAYALGDEEEHELAAEIAAAIVAAGWPRSA